PGSSPQRSTRTSVYGPTSSTPPTLTSSRRAFPCNRLLRGGSGADPNALLEGEGGLRTRVRDRVHRGRRARNGGDARNAGGGRGLADAVAVGPCTGALGGVDDQVAPPLVDQVDHRLLVVRGIGDLRDLVDLEPCRPQDAGGADGRDEVEAETGERRRDRCGG